MNSNSNAVGNFRRERLADCSQGVRWTTHPEDQLGRGQQVFGHQFRQTSFHPHRTGLRMFPIKIH